MKLRECADDSRVERKPGRPCAYTAKVGAAVCELIADGASRREAARVLNIPRRTLEAWLERKPEFKARYEVAAQARLYLMEERLLELSEEAARVAQEAQDASLARVRLEAIKMEMDAVKWQLCKLLPRKYGDKSQMEISGKDGASLLPRHTREEDVAFAAMIAEVQEKLRRKEEERRACAV
ncbi:MAG: helix-turn-helix domain-containing protein [Akkermansiaceae bacterium]|nr:helix-turn-helix domain-containing protein [Akkermansiaceae bacterium]